MHRLFLSHQFMFTGWDLSDAFSCAMAESLSDDVDGWRDQVWAYEAR